MVQFYATVQSNAIWADSSLISPSISSELKGLHRELNRRIELKRRAGLNRRIELNRRIDLNRRIEQNLIGIHIYIYIYIYISINI